VTNALDGNVSLTVEGHNETADVDVNEIEEQNGLTSIALRGYQFESSGGDAVTKDIVNPDGPGLGGPDDPSGFDTYKVSVSSVSGSSEPLSGLTVTLKLDGSSIATVEKPLPSDALPDGGEWVIEVQSP
jgi:hypothetical protein